MLTHHDSRSYEEAAAAAAKHAREKLNEIIHGPSAVRAATAVKAVWEDIPQDRLISGQAMQFVPVGNGVEVMAEAPGLPPLREALHNHALQQLTSRAGIPRTFVDYLRFEKGEKGSQLLAHNLRELYRGDEALYLTRSVRGTMRGFLSDRFRRIDARPTIEAFTVACQALGAVPVEGYALDVKVAIKAMIPQIFEPVPSEVMAFGVMISNSDYGAGALSVRGFCMRLWCTNYAIAEEGLREVHLGKRVTEENLHMFSQETQDLDSATQVSAVKDVVRGALGPAAIEGFMARIKEAHEQGIDFKKELTRLRDRSQIGKAESERVADIYRNGGIEQLPQGDNLWRFSNALSWIANETEDQNRKLELMTLAGGVLPGVKKAQTV